ncbi:synaptonemal complex protein 1 isoform X2 [Scyliorhinus canicula]|uniref:synaptonemal complex protein 1 isoform X2 n=1 Tax=Scyliorhinus canicula TaxID=7830 RepID=UPI0018F6F042|nr:synaptonemal complex protein 1 isoform X2 [Scyliorhinus canicula]
MGVQFLRTSTPKLSKTGIQDFIEPILLKPQKMRCVEKENIEHISQLYTKLFHEAEKIKRWKLVMDNELWQKDKRLQENKQTIEVQRKAIQEQQFENESLSMKLEEEMNKNEEATKLHNSTRDLCSLVKESCSRSTEKLKTYEAERDETRRLYVENAENIERIIMAFEELRKQAENSRLEIIFKLKEEIDQREQVKNKCQQQLNEKENEVQQLQQQYKQKGSELHETWIQLQESKLRCDQLEEAIRHLNENLQESRVKEQNLAAEREKTEDILKNREISQKSLQEELENAMKVIIQLTNEKETEIEEFNKITSNSTSTIAELRNTVEHLEESFKTEQQRSKQVQEAFQVSSLELEKKTAALVELEQFNIENELKINQLTEALKEKTKSQDKLEEELTSEKLERGKYFEDLESAKKIQNDLHDKVEILLQEIKEIQKVVDELMKENTNLKEVAESKEDKVEILLQEIKEIQKVVDELMKENTNLKEVAESKERAISEMEGQIINSRSKERECFERMNSLTAGIEEERKRHENLSSDCNILLAEKETFSHDLHARNAEIEDLQKKLEIFEHKEGSAIEELKVLKKQNNQLKEEIKALEKTLKQQDEVADSKLEEKEECSKNLQNEVKKKDKLMKTMENKSKSLKKKFMEETKQCSVYKTEIEQLNLELSSLNKQSKDTIQNLQKKVEEGKLDNEKLTEEVKTLKLTTEAALQTQKETEIMCQNKIAEMVTLMEKHKHQYDKMVDEKDAELKCWKEKELKINLSKKPLEIELSSVKDALSIIKQELKKVTEEKEVLVRQTKAMKDTNKSLKDELKKKMESNSVLKTLNNTASNREVPSTPMRKNCLMAASKSAELPKQPGSIIQSIHTWTPAEKARIAPNHQTYTIRTPPFIQNKILKGTMKAPCGEVLQKKRKVVLDLDAQSDSSEHSDLLSMIPESEMFRELYKGNSEAAYLFGKSQQQVTSPAKPKTYGSVLKLAAVKKMRAAGWEAVAKESRKKRMKTAEEIF